MWYGPTAEHLPFVGAIKKDMAEEILEMLLESVYTKEDHPGQEHEYNYVFEVTTWDPDTGEIFMDHEYKTFASDDYYDEIDAYAEMEDYMSDVYGTAGTE